MQSISEILKKVRELEIKSKKLAKNLLSGGYHSAFKGRGMLFKEVREYAEGDDVRFIDWNVSARLGHLYSKLFEEERELTVMLLIDISNSNLPGTNYASKRHVATEIAAVLAFSAVSNGDKVGAMLYGNDVEMYIAPQKGRQHALYIVREMVSVVAKSDGTRLAQALRRFNNLIKQSSIVFILSDFVDTDYEDALRIVGKKHDLIGIKVYDILDKELPHAGLMPMQDAETGRVQWMDTCSAFVRKKYEDYFFEQTEHCASSFKKAGSHLLHIKTGDDYVSVLQRFFVSRSKWQNVKNR